MQIMQALTVTDLAERTDKAVEESGLTQQEVADKLDITQAAVSQAVNPRYKGVNGTRIKILLELQDEEVRPGFLVEM